MLKTVTSTPSARSFLRQVQRARSGVKSDTKKVVGAGIQESEKKPCKKEFCEGSKGWSNSFSPRIFQTRESSKWNDRIANVGRTFDENLDEFLLHIGKGDATPEEKELCKAMLLKGLFLIPKSTVADITRSVESAYYPNLTRLYNSWHKPKHTDLPKDIDDVSKVAVCGKSELKGTQKSSPTEDPMETCGLTSQSASNGPEGTRRLCSLHSSPHDHTLSSVTSNPSKFTAVSDMFVGKTHITKQVASLNDVHLSQFPQKKTNKKSATKTKRCKKSDRKQWHKEASSWDKYRSKHIGNDQACAHSCEDRPNRATWYTAKSNKIENLWKKLNGEQSTNTRLSSANVNGVNEANGTTVKGDAGAPLKGCSEQSSSMQTPSGQPQVNLTPKVSKARPPRTAKMHGHEQSSSAHVHVGNHESATITSGVGAPLKGCGEQSPSMHTPSGPPRVNLTPKAGEAHSSLTDKVSDYEQSSSARMHVGNGADETVTSDVGASLKDCNEPPSSLHTASSLQTNLEPGSGEASSSVLHDQVSDYATDCDYQGRISEPSNMREALQSIHTNSLRQVEKSRSSTKNQKTERATESNPHNLRTKSPDAHATLASVPANAEPDRTEAPLSACTDSLRQVEEAQSLIMDKKTEYATESNTRDLITNSSDTHGALLSAPISAEPTEPDSVSTDNVTDGNEKGTVQNVPSHSLTIQSVVTATKMSENFPRGFGGYFQLLNPVSAFASETSSLPSDQARDYAEGCDDQGHISEPTNTREKPLSVSTNSSHQVKEAQSLTKNRNAVHVTERDPHNLTTKSSNTPAAPRVNTVLQHADSVSANNETDRAEKVTIQSVATRTVISKKFSRLFRGDLSPINPVSTTVLNTGQGWIQHALAPSSVSTTVPDGPTSKDTSSSNQPTHGRHCVDATKSAADLACERAMAKNLPSISELEEKEELCMYLERVLRAGYDRHVILELFGSTKNGFAFRDSDLDICLTMAGSTMAESYDRATIEDITRVLRKTPGITGVFPIRHARVPIIKFSLANERCEGDISMFNCLAVHNTRMLRCYSDMDERCRTLGYMLKSVARENDLCSVVTGALSSYAYIILLIYFLQQTSPPVLPVLQELYQGPKSPEVIVNGWNTWFYDDVDNLSSVWEDFGKNTKSVGRLWEELLHFYNHQFDFKREVVSIRRRARLSTQEKVSSLRSHPSFRGGNGRISRHLAWGGKYMYIEDPFDLEHNLAGRLSYTTASNIISTVFSPTFDLD